MPFYEAVFILKFTYVNLQYNIQELLLQLKQLTKNKINIIRHEYWGLIRFQYIINKKKKGHYCMVQFELDEESVAAMKKALNVNDNFVRYLIIREDKLDERPSPILVQGDAEALNQ